MSYTLTRPDEGLLEDAKNELEASEQLALLTDELTQQAVYIVIPSDWEIREWTN